MQTFQTAIGELAVSADTCTVASATMLMSKSFRMTQVIARDVRDADYLERCTASDWKGVPRGQSSDTLKRVDAAAVTAASAAGAHLINDVRALQREGALEAAVAASLPVCLMHMQNQPKSMQSNPTYTDVVTEVLDFLQQRKQACLTAGIVSEQILLDPGFGFGIDPKRDQVP